MKTQANNAIRQINKASSTEEAREVADAYFASKISPHKEDDNFQRITSKSEYLVRGVVPKFQKEVLASTEYHRKNHDYFCRKHNYEKTARLEALAVKLATRIYIEPPLFPEKRP